MCQIKINGNLFNVKTFLSPKDIEKGMMSRTFKDLNCDGALFVMDDDEHHFWMKNCVISLDIVFIDGDTGMITGIHKNCRPCLEDECPRYKGYGDFVLELPGGTCIKNDINIDDKVVFDYEND